ncbi:unnamed protein product [Absidia cylindrospora]
MTFLYSPRSLKRNRLLKKISLVCLVLSLGVLFYLAKNGPDNELRSTSLSSSSSSIRHQRYHLHEQENNKPYLKINKVSKTSNSTSMLLYLAMPYLILFEKRKKADYLESTNKTMLMHNFL